MRYPTVRSDGRLAAKVRDSCRSACGHGRAQPAATAEAKEQKAASTGFLAEPCGGPGSRCDNAHRSGILVAEELRSAARSRRHQGPARVATRAGLVAIHVNAVLAVVWSGKEREVPGDTI